MSRFEDTRRSVETTGREAGPEVTGLLVALMGPDDMRL